MSNTMKSISFPLFFLIFFCFSYFLGAAEGVFLTPNSR